MPLSAKLVTPSPVEIKRAPWMRRIHLHSPKLGRSLVLFSYQSLKLWALIESHPPIVTFCEYPGYVLDHEQRLLAHFWIQRGAQQEFLVLDEDLDLSVEHPHKVPTFANARLRRITDAEIEPYQAWIDNWMSINPYLVSNRRFVTPQMLRQALDFFSAPHALFDAEYALREHDPMLARTAVFMLLHQGRLQSEELSQRPWTGATVFGATAAPD